MVSAHRADDLGVGRGGHGGEGTDAGFARVSAFNILLKARAGLVTAAPQPCDHRTMSDDTTPERDYSLFGDDHIAIYRETNGETGHIWNGVPCLILTTGARTARSARCR